MMTPARSDAQVLDIISIINAAAKKVVVALDLAVQKAEVETLGLQNTEKDLDNSMQQSELGDITSWVQQTKDLYANYFQELWEIKNAINAYDRVKDLIAKEAAVVSGYQQSYAAVQKDSHFTADEVAGMYRVLNGIMQQSVNNLSQIDLVITALLTQMADADRLRIIDEAGSRIDKNYSDLQTFSQRNTMLSLERAQDSNDILATKALYGIP